MPLLVFVGTFLTALFMCRETFGYERKLKAYQLCSDESLQTGYGDRLGEDQTGLLVFNGAMEDGKTNQVTVLSGEKCSDELKSRDGTVSCNVCRRKGQALSGDVRLGKHQTLITQFNLRDLPGHRGGIIDLKAGEINFRHVGMLFEVKGGPNMILYCSSNSPRYKNNVLSIDRLCSALRDIGIGLKLPAKAGTVQHTQSQGHAGHSFK